MAAGFQAPEAIVLDYIAPYQTSAGILASRQTRATKPSRVTLLCHSPEAPYVTQMRDSLELRSIGIDLCRFGQNLPDQDVISLLDLQDPIVHGMSEHAFGTLVSHFQSLKRNMLWVGPASQVNCEDPRAAMILGLTRTARNEMSVKIFTVEVDSMTPPSIATDAITKILLRINTPTIDLEHTDPDYEFAVSNGEILIPRLHWQTMYEAFGHKKENRVSSRKQIDVKTPGLLRTICWNEGTIGSPAEGEVVVQAKAAGLNFRVRIIIHMPSYQFCKLTLTLTPVIGPYDCPWCLEQQPR